MGKLLRDSLWFHFLNIVTLKEDARKSENTLLGFLQVCVCARPVARVYMKVEMACGQGKGPQDTLSRGARVGRSFLGEGSCVQKVCRWLPRDEKDSPMCRWGRDLNGHFCKVITRGVRI